jgi:DNA-binding transcriptional MerR regulator
VVEQWASSIAHLAAAIGVTRQTIHNWQKREGCPSPRSNGKYLVSEWAKFGKEVSTAAAITGEGEADKYKLECRKLKAHCEKAEHALAVQRGEYTRNDEIAEEIRRLIHETETVLRNELETKMSPDVRKKNRAALDRAMERLHKGGEQIIAKHPMPPAAEEDDGD